jgi:hypothetical protein
MLFFNALTENRKNICIFRPFEPIKEPPPLEPEPSADDGRLASCAETALVCPVGTASWASWGADLEKPHLPGISDVVTPTNQPRRRKRDPGCDGDFLGMAGRQ